MPDRALKFAVVREDPDLEAELVRRVSAKKALVVASGGCTALTLVHRFPALQVTAFDLHPGALTHPDAKRDAVRRQDLAALNVQDTSITGLNQKGEFETFLRPTTWNDWPPQGPPGVGMAARDPDRWRTRRPRRGH